MNAWWLHNDALRSDAEASDTDSQDASAPWRRNIEAILPLVQDEDPQDALMKAKILRELGQFEAAKEALAELTSEELGRYVTLIRALCDKEDLAVREVK